MIRVVLPYHLRTLARIDGEVGVEAGAAPTIRAVLAVLEDRYPVLQGLIRDRGTLRRRPFVRFYVCGEDWSHDADDDPLPAAVVDGREPLLVVGAMAGG